MADKPCPNCGHCPACGRSNFKPWNPYPYGTYYPGTYYPYWSTIGPNTSGGSYTGTQATFTASGTGGSYV